MQKNHLFKNMVCLFVFFTFTTILAQGPVFELIFEKDFEDQTIGPPVSIHTKGTFSQAPGLRSTTFFDSQYAFGFGTSTCSTSCWTNYETTLRITLNDPVPIAYVMFKMAELNGNWGSSGYIYVDGHRVENSLFNGASTTFQADTVYREKIFPINRIGREIDIFVTDIANTSEIQIDDIQIIAYLPDGHEVYVTDFETGALDPNITIIQGAIYSETWGFRPGDLFGSTQAFGFGKSDCDINCQQKYTEMIVSLPDAHHVASVQFKDVEPDTNWGARGRLFLDGHGIAASSFGRIPINDNKVDTTTREYMIPVYMRGDKIKFNVHDITEKSEIQIDDVVIRAIEPMGDPIFVEDFEDGVLAPEITICTHRNLTPAPGIKDTTFFGSNKSFGFGKSLCETFCHERYTSWLKIELPGTLQIGGLSFNAAELDGNFGGQGRIFIDGVPYPGVDFARQPSNDGEADSLYRNFLLPVNLPVQTIEFRVWDITRTSEVFIDDIMLFGGEVSVEENVLNLAEQFELYPAYPNPFNPKTVISYRLPVVSPVHIRIFNSRGELVKTLLNRTQSPGLYKVEFDASELASGLYVYKVQAGKISKTGKMLLLK